MDAMSVGETLDVAERVVVSNVAPGQFRVVAKAVRGTRIEEGDVVGLVGDQPVRSAFSGVLMGVLAVEGERVIPHQAVAWLRSVAPALR